MKSLILLCAAFVLFALPAYANGQHCYSPAEVQAEQLLRLHSELMVITVTCHQGSRGQDLVNPYTTFTQNNVDAIRQAEQTMIHHYKAEYGGDAVSRLDKLRTMLANEYGQQVADVSAPLFCAQRRDKVLAMCYSNRGYMQSEVNNMCVTARTYEPPCVAASATRTASHY